MLLGLSIASAIIIRFAVLSTSSWVKGVGRKKTPSALNGTPRPVASRRISMSAVRHWPPKVVMSEAKRFACSASHSTTSGL
ncbi:unannotated protein [freshwater metagenome]|uniref:Unannotated protein n=1 Tax=freshwater metagenome TaxID=449393 RepID=A0A6J6MFZ4_9ZZZZ